MVSKLFIRMPIGLVAPNSFISGSTCTASNDANTAREAFVYL